MGIIITIFLVFYSSVLGVIALIGFFRQIHKEKKYVSGFENELAHIDLKELVVIIPFRNEEKRIDGLLKSILNSNELPKEFIFIDDHSTDKCSEVISEMLKAIPFRILQLPTNLEGKKRAIRYAIENSNSTHILSLDADVEFKADYFSNLNQLASADLYILPAILEAEAMHEYLFEVDVVLVNALNTGLSGLKRPIIASGANLLYERSSFETYDRFESHAHMSSGDDIYLLRDFRNAEADVRLVSDPNFAVHTETPKSLKELIHQRLRWVAKTGDVKDPLSNVLAILQILLTMSFVGILIYLGIKCDWRILFGFFMVKTSFDMLIFLPFFNRIKRMKTWLFIPVYELIFPVYSLMILFLMFTFKPVWKGRKI